MTLDTNPGDRPSLLAVDRVLSGEISDPAVDAWLETEAGRRHVAGIEASRAALGPPDLHALRARAAHDDTPATPVPQGSANNTRWFVLAVLVAVAALLAIRLPLGEASDPVVDPTYVGVRGASLEVYHLRANDLHPYDDRDVGEGDVLGFLVDPGAHTGVVLLSVDGDGTVAVHYPAEGTAPEPIDGKGPLPGSILLDDAPGPETFVAVFGTDVRRARAALEAAWQTDGMEGVVDWSRERGDVDAVVVNRR
jgi:hypothetical protein